MTITYGSADFAAAMKGATMVASPPGEHSVTEVHSSDEFDRFATLTERLLHVPKGELDAKRVED